MFKHNVLMALRSMRKYKVSLIINLIGLTTGLTCFVLIYLWVADEHHMDGFHANADRLYQVMEHQNYADRIMTTTSTPGILAETLAEEIPEIEYAATTTWVTTNTLSIDDLNIKADGYYVGSDFFLIFSYGLYEGNPEQVLKDKSSIVISRDLATKLFGTDQNIIGETLEFQHDETFTVSGIFEGTPRQSSVQFDFVLPFERFKDQNEWVLSWGNNGPSTIVTLVPGVEGSIVSQKIASFVADRNEESNVTLFLKPYAERYLYGRYENGQPDGGRIEYVRLFSIIAGFILVIACINFMNLSTARSSRRALEVGIKKTIGAGKWSLVWQFLSESLCLAYLSMMLATLAVWLFLPQFNQMTDKTIVLNLNGSMSGFLLIIATLTGLLAGSYPAFYLSGFRPIKVLKGTVKGSGGELWIRRGLVIFQFVLSVILIVAVLCIYRQIDFVQSKNLGYDKDQVIQFPIEGQIEARLEAFLSGVKNLPGVINASSMGHSLMGRNNNTSGLEWDGKDPSQRILFENLRVSHDFVETMGIDMVEGRSFNRDFGADTARIVFNEAAMKIIDYDGPLGRSIRLWDEYDLEIIGVVKDFHFQSLHEEIKPLFMMLNPENTWNAVVKLESGKEREVISQLRTFYSQFNPGFEFDYVFLDEEYSALYAAEQRVSTLSRYFAGFAILISCLGLFGLASFTAERRLKEIGIRKTLGSSVAGIVLLLSKDFTYLVLISIAIALPVGYIIMNRWMSQFAYQADIPVTTFVIAGAAALMIAWLTISSQAFRAARINPADCLRNE